MQVPLEDPLKKARVLGPRDAGSMAKANGIELCYDTFGNRDAAPLLLIMGLAAQMIEWDEEFCEELALRGYFVVRFDNRDVGLSTKLPQLGAPNVQALFSPATAGRHRGGALHARRYGQERTRSACFDALGIERAHIVGLSMGGAIAQLMAIRRAGRVRTLTSIMSSTGVPFAAGAEARGGLRPPHSSAAGS